MAGDQETQDPGLQALASALAHPLRARLLYSLARRPRQTSRQLSELVGEPVHKVNYQLRELLKRGLVAIVATGERRGAIERRFETSRRPLLAPQEEHILPFVQLRRIRLGTLRLILSDVTNVLRESAAFRDGDRFARFEMDVDETGWEELSAIHLQAYTETLEVWDRSVERLAADDSTPIGVTAATILLAMPCRPPARREDGEETG